MPYVMKFRLFFLSMFVASFAHGQGPKPGTNEDPIRQSLFAAHPVRQLLGTVQATPAPGPLMTIIQATKLADAGRKPEAIAGYQQALANPSIGTQLSLWAWNGLRELGQQPDARIAREILGVVIEVKTKGGYDTLAGYADGTARYISGAGAGIVWDLPDDILKFRLQALILAARDDAAKGKARVRQNLLLPTSEAQLTLLTRSGPYVITEPSTTVLAKGADVVQELIKRNEAEAGKQKKQP